MDKRHWGRIKEGDLPYREVPVLAFWETNVALEMPWDIALFDAKRNTWMVFADQGLCDANEPLYWWYLPEPNEA